MGKKVMGKNIKKLVSAHRFSTGISARGTSSSKGITGGK
jgi:hypothetical protein